MQICFSWACCRLLRNKLSSPSLVSYPRHLSPCVTRRYTKTQPVKVGRMSPSSCWWAALVMMTKDWNSWISPREFNMTPACSHVTTFSHVSAAKCPPQCGSVRQDLCAEGHQPPSFRPAPGLTPSIPRSPTRAECGIRPVFSSFRPHPLKCKDRESQIQDMVLKAGL